MLALCSMLLPPYYAPNYAGIIGSSLFHTRGLLVRRLSARGAYIAAARKIRFSPVFSKLQDKRDSHGELFHNM